jgi:hypothetical protein
MHYTKNMLSSQREYITLIKYIFLVCDLCINILEYMHKQLQDS